ncbi:MAG: hypothetical protein CK536_07460 [Synechococcus sp. Baikal-G1]|nr:MAG: hypothetical protein CK536_07460 [Synechococcus sp. Baikal-G1]
MAAATAGEIKAGPLPGPVPDPSLNPQFLAESKFPVLVPLLEAARIFCLSRSFRPLPTATCHGFP